MMKRFLIILVLAFLGCLPAFSQIPTFVQHVSCPNSRNTGNAQSSTPDYRCPLPEPSQAGNALLVGVMSYDGATFTVSDDKSNPWTLVDSVVDSNYNIYVGIYLATNVVAGTRFIDLHRSAGTDNVAMSVSEYYNVAASSALDTSSCNAGSSSTTITAGSITPTVSGDLLWQWTVNGVDGGGLPNSTISFAAGSQSNISWQFLGTDLYDGDAVQAGIYSASSAINPTFTSGSLEEWSSCVVALKAASAGNAPTSAFRIVHMLHQQMPASGANPWPIQFASSGNLVVLSALNGTSSISSISSSPSNTWSSTGTAAMGGDNVSQIYYAANASTSNSLTLAVTLDNTGNATFMMYDIMGAATSPFDVDSGGQTGDEGSIVSTLTTCSSCLTPAGANELIIANFGQDWCTATSISAPSGALFDSATDTGNSVNGPQFVDQNNGWMHFYDSGTSALNVTWGETCGTEAEGAWAGRVAAFKAKEGTSVALVSSVNPSVFNEGVTFTATVTATSGTPTGTVTFKNGSATLGKATLSAGEAAFTTSTLAVGAHSITAVYGGSTDFSGSTSPVLTQTVDKAGTSVVLVSSVNPSAFHEAVIFTATVTPATSGTPTGTVTFRDGATTLGTGSLNASGVATFSIRTLKVGSHSITAVYSGNADFLTSTSTKLTQTVSKASTTTKLTSSLNPSKQGQAVTFTATITPAFGGPPSGTVAFKDGTTTLGTGTVNPPTHIATFTTSTLAVGTHHVTASYGGDTDFKTSTSAVLNQVVNE